jgi:hypothetical protein
VYHYPQIISDRRLLSKQRAVLVWRWWEVAPYDAPGYALARPIGVLSKWLPSVPAVSA